MAAGSILGTDAFQGSRINSSFRSASKKGETHRSRWEKREEAEGVAPEITRDFEIDHPIFETLALGRAFIETNSRSSSFFFISRLGLTEARKTRWIPV